MANRIMESSRGYDAISLEDEFLRNRKIFLDDTVTPESVNELIKQLMFLDNEDSGAEITLYINSPGGSVQDGLALYDVLRLVKAPVRTVAAGMAASMGAVLFLAGDKREMLKHSKIMIHDPSFHSKNIGGQKSHEIQHALDDLNECREALAQIIAERTGKSIEEVYEVTANDTYFNASEALEWGLATAIIGEKKKGGRRHE